MKESKFTEPEIPAVPKQSESGAPVPAPAHSLHNLAQNTLFCALYGWV
jgi:hypothetical protein